MRLTVLDVPIDTFTQREALDKVGTLLRREGSHAITTPNPEFVVEAQKNKLFMKALKLSSLSIPDGTGIVWALRLLHGSKIRRITGVDFMKQICKTYGEEHPIFLLGAKEHVNERTKHILKKKIPGIQIAGNYSGTPASGLDKIICNMINNSGAQILFVAYGAPKQDLWIMRNLPHLKNIKIAMGIGGSFDFISGEKKRAPKWMQKLGLEWLYRLLIEPSRYKRIFTATIRFPLKVWKRKLLRILHIAKTT